MKFLHLLLHLGLVLALCLSTGLSLPVQVHLRHRLLSVTTGRYVSITKSGRVHANGAINLKNPDKDATPLIIDRLPQPNHVRIGSVKYADRSWYIVMSDDGSIRGDVPSNGNEVLEEITLPDGYMVLRVVNYSDLMNPPMEEGSGLSPVTDDGGLLMPETISDSAEVQRECYIGFAFESGRSMCYDNTDSVNVRLQIIPHD